MVLGSGLALALIWLLAWGGYRWAQSRRMTAERVSQYLRSVDLARLSGEARTRALQQLMQRLNALSFEERRSARLDREWTRWFVAMNDPEKVAFIEGTLPAGFKQMLDAFEQLPPDRRRRSVDEALKHLKEARDEMAADALHPPPEWGTNAPPVLSEEVRQKVITTGLKSFYADSSAQTKAEAAPLLEELQRMMESGAFMRWR